MLSLRFLSSLGERISGDLRSFLVMFFALVIGHLGMGIGHLGIDHWSFGVWSNDQTLVIGQLADGHWSFSDWSLVI